MEKRYLSIMLAYNLPSEILLLVLIKDTHKNIHSLNEWTRQNLVQFLLFGIFFILNQESLQQSEDLSNSKSSIHWQYLSYRRLEFASCLFSISWNVHQVWWTCLVPAVTYHIKTSLYFMHQQQYSHGPTHNHCCNSPFPFFFIWWSPKHGNIPRCPMIDNPAGQIYPSRTNLEKSK